MNRIKRIICAVSLSAVIGFSSAACGAAGQSGGESVNVGKGRGSDEVIDTYIDSTLKGADAEAYVGLIPDELFSYMSNDGETAKSDFTAEMQEEFDEQTKTFDENADSWEVSYDILEEESASEEDLADFIAECEEKFGMNVTEKKDVTVEVEIEITIDGESQSDKTETVVTLIKEGDDWYLWGVDGMLFGDTM